MPAYTKISKPSESTYTRLSLTGKETYDESSLTYDDTNAFYDGVNQLQWTDIAKPIGSFESVIRPGMTLGLLIPLTNTLIRAVSTDRWTDINKPT